MAGQLPHGVVGDEPYEVVVAGLGNHVRRLRRNGPPQLQVGEVVEIVGEDRAAATEETVGLARAEEARGNVGQAVSPLFAVWLALVVLVTGEVAETFAQPFHPCHLVSSVDELRLAGVRVNESQSAVGGESQASGVKVGDERRGKGHAVAAVAWIDLFQFVVSSVQHKESLAGGRIESSGLPLDVVDRVVKLFDVDGIVSDGI